MPSTPSADLGVLHEFIPAAIGQIADHQTALPRIARDPKLTAQIESALRQIPTNHDLYNHDARDLDFLAPGSVHLVLTSPPYWTLKEYRRSDGQLGHVADSPHSLLNSTECGHIATGLSLLAADSGVRRRFHRARDR